MRLTSDNRALSRAGTALFLKRWLKRPLGLGAVVPSGSALTGSMARAASAAPAGGWVVELGAGTGVVTAALKSAGLVRRGRFVAVERDAELVRFLRGQFPDLSVREGDAARLPALLAADGVRTGDVGAVVSSLPLLSLPRGTVDGILRGVFGLLAPGGVFVQFTYGPKSPVAPGYCEEFGLIASRGSRVWHNVPPAVVWSFRKTGPRAT